MTREELDFIGSMNMCDEISNEAYKKIVCHCREQEPCEDAISRQAVLESIKNLYPDMPVVDIMGSRRKWLDKYAPYFECENAVEHLPSVNPQPKTGHWINVNEGKWNTIPAYKCSACGANANLRDWSGESPFCPWCGAKMVEPHENEVTE